MEIKSYTWWVSAGMYYKQMGCQADSMEEARKRAYEKLIKMSYEDFCKYIPLNVSGMKNKA